MVSSLVACAFLASSAATAKPTKDGFGVGFQSTWPSYGLSVKKEMSDTLTAQGTLGALGNFTSFGARGLYKFKKEPEYDIYGYGGLSYWSWDYDGYYRGSRNETFNAIGLGLGAGIEYDVAKEITVNGEIGFNLVNWDSAVSGFSSFGIGIGAHYWF